MKCTSFKNLLPILLFLFLGCATPLSKNEIDELTRCNATLTEVRKKLLRAGYSLKANEDDFINTDTKRAGFDGNDLLERSFFVEKINENSVRLKITTRLTYDGTSSEWQTPEGVTDKTKEEYLRIKTYLCD